MKPIGTSFRRNGEQVIVHQCLGCGETRYCRVAADDNVILCAELPVLDLPSREQGEIIDEPLMPDGSDLFGSSIPKVETLG